MTDVPICVCEGRFSWNIKSIGILSVVQYGNCLGVTFGFLTILLRFWTNIFPCWLDVMYQPRSSVCVTRINLGLMINAGMLLASSKRLIFVGPVIALGLTDKSLSTVKWEPMKPTQRPSVSLVIETAMFLWTFSPLISGGPLLSLRCSAQVHHWLRSLVRVVDWCVSRLVRLICCRIILTASSERLLIYRSLVIHLLVLSPLHLGRVSWGVSC